MKAIRVEKTGGPEVLHCVDVARPTAGKGQVVVRTKSISVNFADVMMREGTYPVMPPLPAVLGLEASGIIDEVGEGVTGLSKGQRVSVIGLGCYAEMVAVDASSVIPLPDDVDFDAAAVFPVVYLTGHHLLHTVGNIRRGGCVLLHAAVGGVGTAVIQLAKIAGVRVIGLTSTPDKARRARELGAEHVFMYDQRDLVAEVMKASGGKGVDLVLDSIAGANFSRNFDMLAPLGQVLWYGFAGGPPQNDLLDALLKHWIRGVGLRTFHLVFSVAEPYPQIFGASIGTVLTYLREKKIEPVIADRIPLAEAAKAQQLLQSRDTIGKVILKP